MGKAESPAGLSALLLSAAEAGWAAAAITHQLRTTPSRPAEWNHALETPHRAQLAFLRNRLLSIHDVLYEMGMGLLPAQHRLQNRAPLGITELELGALTEAARDALNVAGERALLRDAVLRKCAAATSRGEPASVPPGRVAACLAMDAAQLRALLSMMTMQFGPAYTKTTKPQVDDAGEMALDRLDLRVRALLATWIDSSLKGLTHGADDSTIPFAMTPREHMQSLVVTRAALKEFEGREAELASCTRSTYEQWRRTLAALERAGFVEVVLD